MSILLRTKRCVVAALVILAIVLQGTTSVLAGTTGSITGTVVNASTNKPIPGARVTAASPSQTSSTTSDASGRYTFLSLTPDTYTVSVAETANNAAYAVNGVTVQADQSLTVSLAQPPRLEVIGTVSSRANSAIVKPGTTADVYSINATTQDKASVFGGGGTLNSAWSSIASVPGVFVSPNQGGYIGAGATVSIRGGDYDQIGYEFDGIPVNRAFDNYPSGPLSSLGQQEVQVYTGATPANSEAEGISGYINQVIKTGTAPATRSMDLAIGSPTFYNKAAFETGGANPAHTFNYYLGLGGYNQDYRYADNFNGASLSQYWGPPLAPCPAPSATVNRNTVPSCFSANGTPYTSNGTVNAFALGPFNAFSQSGVQDRDSVVNVHFGLPHKDGTKDDIQLLYDNNYIRNPYYISTNDQGGAAYANLIGLNTPSYIDGLGFNGAPTGTLLTPGYTGGGTTQYGFPGSSSGRVAFAPIPASDQDAFVNNQAIFKAQYQKNFGTNAFLRLYGYTYYSNWLQYGAQSTYANYVGDVPADYELSSHTRGLSAQFSDQLNSQHLLSVQGSYTTSTTLRDNNTQMYNGLYGPSTLNARTAVGVLVNPTNYLQTGQCYSFTGAAVPCYNSGGTNINSHAGYFNLQQAQNGTVTPASSVNCGGAPCQYLVVGNGQYATYNSVVPKFYSGSITDDWKPTDKLTINLGVRLDVFQFLGSDTTGTPARAFFYTAWNNQFPTLQMVNTPSQIFTYPEWQPRFGATYSLNPSTALRVSYGRYAQAPNSAFEQYDFLQQEAPLGLVNFVNYGIGNTPGHEIRPEVSNNFDFSLEHQFKGDVAIKISPFLRKTQDQIQQFYLDQKTNFVSGLNVGQQTSQGVELEVDKGDFSRNGIAAKLSFTYTDSFIRYTSEPNGGSVVDGINTSIEQYNSYTSACAAPTSTNAKLCGGNYNGVATYASGVANPYYNSRPATLLDQNGNYPTFDTFPGGFNVGYTTYGAPYVATLLVQWKKGPLAITPALQFFGGQRYGVPQASIGVLPDTCSPLPTGSVTGDPRYPGGGAGAPYDATSCTTGLAIPNPLSGQFDGIGAFVQPSQLQLHLQVAYDINKRITLVGNFANLYTSCFGGTKVPWSVSGACSYTSTVGFNPPGQPAGYPQYVGNVYNPGNNIQPFQATPYYPLFKAFPFNMYVEARIKV